MSDVPCEECDSHDPVVTGAICVPCSNQKDREIERLRHIARTAGDFRDQIHHDVEWDRVPPWTMDVVRELDRLLAAFDEEDDARIARDGELP